MYRRSHIPPWFRPLEAERHGGPSLLLLCRVFKVGKHITSIEGVPSGVSSRATHLFLSNNSLRSLGGLESFSGVACLSLSHNLVRRTEDLRPLTSLVRLEMLSLEGNPVCGAANYRAHVVSLASPCLKTLDRREVRMRVSRFVLLVFLRVSRLWCVFACLQHV